MARRARVLLLGIALSWACGASATGQGPSFAGIGAESRAARNEAVARLRASLTTADLPNLLAAARAGKNRVREDLTETLLDREDLYAAWLRDPKDEDLTFLGEVVGATFLRKYPNMLPEASQAFDVAHDLFESLGESRTWYCTEEAMDLDDLAAEIRWARVAPFPVLVDPLQPSKTLTLGKAVFPSEALGFIPWVQNQMQLLTMGAERSGELKTPSLLVVGTPFLGSVPPNHVAQASVRVWREGVDLTAMARIATAVLALDLSPLGGSVVRALVSVKGDSAESERRAAAAFRAICDVPERGAALLATDAAALDAFAARALSVNSAHANKLWRVFNALPAKDGAGRDVNTLLCQWYSSAEAARRTLLLAVLAARRAASARGLFAGALETDIDDGVPAAVAGLSALRDPELPAMALAALDRANSGPALRALASVLIHSSDGRGTLLSNIDNRAGLRRAAILAILLVSNDRAVVASAADSLSTLTDAKEMELVLAILRESRNGVAPVALRQVLLPLADSGQIHAILALDAAGAVNPGSADAYARALTADPEEGLRDLRSAAAGAMASTSWVLTHFAEQYPASKRSPPLSSALSRLIAGHWRRSSRMERSELAASLSGGENTPLEDAAPAGARRVLSLAELARLFLETGQWDLLALPVPIGDSVLSTTRRIRYLPAVDRGTPFPSIDPRMERLVP